MRNEIRKYLMEHRASEEVAGFGDGDSLLESGVIDSLTMVDLIAHLERSYRIQIGEDDLIPENFDSLDAIVSYVRQKQSERVRAADCPASTGSP